MIILLFVYQNCMGPGFVPVSNLRDNAIGGGATGPPTWVPATPTPVPSPTPRPTPSPTPAPTPSPPTVATSVSGTELVPLAVHVAASGTLVSTLLPAGALYDQATQMFRWLPKRGQAGTYLATFRLTRSGGPVYAVNLNLTIAPFAEAALLAGPPDAYAEGDVGYVFVHGAGNVDRCSNHADLLAYWGASPAILEPDPAKVKLACYDSRQAAEIVAPSVAQQILDSDCGRFQKCVAVTHSMGGLVMEFILLHGRAANSSDPEPGLFAEHDLYKRAADKVAFVISLSTAAGGSKVATILYEEGDSAPAQEIVATIEGWLGVKTGAYNSTTVRRATGVLAPLNADPGVPVFLVAGYSRKTVREAEGDFFGFFDSFFDNVPDSVYNGDQKSAELDDIVQFDSRGDGLVDFRGACGILSDNPRAGPGYDASVAQHMQYCFFTQRKANHYPWFAINLNHFLLPAPWPNCATAKNPCRSTFPDYARSTYSEDQSERGRNAAQVMRTRLTTNRFGFSGQTLTFDVDAAIAAHPAI